MLGNEVFTYITFPTTSGFPSWPRSVPNEKLQAALRSFTFAVVICFSGLNRCTLKSRPGICQSPSGALRVQAPARAPWALATAANATLAATPENTFRVKRFITDLRMKGDSTATTPIGLPMPSGPPGAALTNWRPEGRARLWAPPRNPRQRGSELGYARTGHVGYTL